MKLGEKLTEGPIFKKFVLFVIPIVITSFLQQMYNAADTVIVGQFAGKSALAAVGATSSVSALIITLFMGLSVGTNVVCAGFFGASNKDGIQKALHTSLLLGFLLGIPLTLVGWFGAKTFLTFTDTPESVIEDAALYMRIFFLGIPASLIYNFGSAALRAIGETKKPMYILLIAGLANVFLNYVFVAVLKQGVVGVALGTIVSQAISAIWVLLIFARNSGELHLSIRKLRVYRSVLVRILAIGFPAGLNGIMFSLSGVVIQTAINSFNEAVVASHSVAWNYMAFSNLLVAAGEQGIVSFVGQNMGAHLYNRVKQSVRMGLLIMTTVSMAFSSVIVIFAEPLLGIFTNDIDIIQGGMAQIYYAISVYFLFVPSLIFGGALRGMGKSMIPTVINLVGICLLRVLWIWCVWTPINPESLVLVYISFPVTWIVSGIAMTIAYMTERRNLRDGGIVYESRRGSY